MIAIPRLRPIALGFALLAALALQIQYLPATYIVALIPFGALLIGGVADWAWAWRPTVGRHAVRKRKKRPGRASRLVARPLVVPTLAVGVAAAVLAAPAWADQNRKLLDAPADRPMRQATEWVVRNVPVVQLDRRRCVLGRPGPPQVRLRPRPLGRQVRHRSHPCFYGGGCPVNNYIISTPTVRASISAFPLTRAVLRTSVVAASFGSGRDRVEVRRIIDVAGEKLRVLQKKLDAERVVAASSAPRCGPNPHHSAAAGGKRHAPHGLRRQPSDERAQRPRRRASLPGQRVPGRPETEAVAPVSADLVVPSAPSDPSGSMRIVDFLKSQPPPLRPRRVSVVHGIPGNRDGVRVTYRQPG